ncbi:MAG: S-methyl-5-thioribose-1-phosphate isomerase [Watsoniomyces obsoletus]|nr:MAG: S-methyl-5-thioribose-1-phosphate isomerase [Watsoniomyces obsoletus]
MVARSNPSRHDGQDPVSRQGASARTPRTGRNRPEASGQQAGRTHLDFDAPVPTLVMRSPSAHPPMLNAPPSNDWRFTWNRGLRSTTPLSPFSRPEVPTPLGTTRPTMPSAHNRSVSPEHTKQESVSEKDAAEISSMQSDCSESVAPAEGSTMPTIIPLLDTHQVEPLSLPLVQSAIVFPQSVPGSHASVALAAPILRHQLLFQRLLEICTDAARHCWQHEASAYVPGTRFVLNPRSSGRRGSMATKSRSRTRPSPYGLISVEQQRSTPSKSPREVVLLDPLHTRHPLELSKHVFRIADALWTRAKRDVSSPVSANLNPPSTIEMGAVSRMQSLYQLSDRIISAISMLNEGGWFPYGNDAATGLVRFADADDPGEVVLAETIDVGAVVLAARNLCALCSYEDATGAIEDAWTEFLNGR